MEAYVFKNAFSEYMRVKRIIVWLLVAGGLYMAAKLFLTVNGDEGRQESYSMLSSLLLFRMLPLASAIFSSGVLSQEIEQKTVVYLLTRPIPRPQFLLLRTLASALAVMIVAGLSAVALSAAVYGGFGLSNPYLFHDLLAVAVGALAYGTLFVLVGMFHLIGFLAIILFAGRIQPLRTHDLLEIESTT